MSREGRTGNHPIEMGTLALLASSWRGGTLNLKGETSLGKGTEVQWG